MSESEGVGTLAEEAARLFGALSGLAREHGADLHGGLADLSGRAVAAARGVEEHVATGGADCTYCPVCRVIHVVRETSPEVREHLAVAASALVQAAAGLLATAASTDPRSDAGHGVEHIDLDGDVPAEDLDPDEGEP
ncbi:MAG: hypothetical protein ABIQ15_00300 [Nocardioides sp.]